MSLIPVETEAVRRQPGVAPAKMNGRLFYLGDHLRARRLPVRLRHRGDLRRRADDPVALGTEPGSARSCHGGRALRHRGRIADRRMAGRSVRTTRDAAMGRCALHHLGRGLRLRVERGVVHHRAGHWRNRHRHLDRRRAALHLRDRDAGAPREARRDVPVQHRARHRRRVRLQRAAGGHRRRRLALDARRGGLPIGDLHPDVLRHSREPPLAAHAPGRSSRRDPGARTHRAGSDSRAARSRWPPTSWRRRPHRRTRGASGRCGCGCRS